MHEVDKKFMVASMKSVDEYEIFRTSWGCVETVVLFMDDDDVPCIIGGLVSNSENAGSNSRNGGIAGGRRPFCICCAKCNKTASGVKTVQYE
jgi:hypothetical protein